MIFVKGTQHLLGGWARNICNALGRSYYKDMDTRTWVENLLYEARNVGALRYDPSNNILGNSFLVVEDPERLGALFAAIEAHCAREDLGAL